jgi:hypothetical protein
MTTLHEQTGTGESSATSSSCSVSSTPRAPNHTGPLTRFMSSAWAMVLGLGFLCFGAGTSMATHANAEIQSSFSPSTGWQQTMLYPNVAQWLTLPCYAIGLVLLICWRSARRRTRVAR